MKLSDSEMSSGIINSPQSQNQNMLPIGPSALGVVNFDSGGYTAVADTPSALGLGDAIQIRVSAGGDYLSFDLTPTLAAFLSEKTVTLVVSGVGNGGTAVLAKPTLWENSVPSFANKTFTSSTGINASDTNLQVAYLTATLSTGLTSFSVGVTSGGISGLPIVKLETMALLLGEIKAEGVSFN